MSERSAIEWPTFALIVCCTGLWVMGTTYASEFWLPLGFIVTTLMIALHSSLSHEVLHGHPFKTQWLVEGLIVVSDA